MKTRSQIALERLEAIEKKKQREDEERRAQARKAAADLRAAKKALEEAQQADFDEMVLSIGAELCATLSVTDAETAEVVKNRVLREDVINASRKALDRYLEAQEQAGEESETETEEVAEATPEAQTEQPHDEPVAETSTLSEPENPFQRFM